MNSKVTKPKRTGCELPIFLPDRKLSQQEVEFYWSKDRARLVACYGSEAAGWKYIDRLDEEFAKADRK